MTSAEMVAVAVAASILIGLGCSLVSEYRSRRKALASATARIIEAPGGERFIEQPIGASVGLLTVAALFNVYEIARISLASEVLTQIAQALIWIGGNLVLGFLINVSRKRAFVLHKRETGPAP